MKYYVFMLWSGTAGRWAVVDEMGMRLTISVDGLDWGDERSELRKASVVVNYQVKKRCIRVVT
jgi:hypothetical protein